VLRLNKRQKEILQVQLDNEKAVLKKLESNYRDALGEIDSKIELLLARQDADMQHVIYQVEYQKALKTQVQSILENLQTKEFETISEYLAKSYEDGFIGTMYDLQGQGIPLIFPIDQAQVLAAIQHETKLSESLYASLGHDIKDLQKKIAGEISRGLSTGQMYSEISRNISSWAQIPKNRAKTIARTEAHRIQCKATMDAQYKAKEKGADIVKLWDSALDGKTRDSHRDLDGQIRELEEEFEVNDHKAMAPGGFGRPEEDINCRCALLQRARWALGNDYTKWSADAPIVYSDDGTAQLAIIEAKNYSEFAQKYTKAVEKMEESGKIVFKEAKNTKEAEDFAKSLGISNVSFKGSDVKVANAMNKSLTNALNYSSSVKERMNFYGVTQERNKLLKADLENYFDKYYRKNYPGRSDAWYAEYAKKSASQSVGKVGSNNWATAFSGKTNSIDDEIVEMMKKYAGVGVNGKVAKDSQSFLQDLKRNVDVKFHPIGCDTIESVFDHEFGHQIDYAYGLSNDEEVIKLWNKFIKLSAADRDNALSRYAHKDGKIQEFIAESYAEYLNNDSPREYAKAIGNIVERKVKGNE
jgi:SPP1 gp7 family putative phage head morphogenesis protein